VIINRHLRRRHASGFSLLEVLITIVIVSVGLLGMAALQGFSLKANQSANSRTKATALAYMIIDRMRAHGGGALATAAAYYGSGSGIAAQDLADWNHTGTNPGAIQKELGADATGQLIFTTAGEIGVLITWTDAQWAISTAPTCNALVTDATKCAFRLVTKL
jgi:type IV pilus assembly protein PilV